MARRWWLVVAIGAAVVIVAAVIAIADGDESATPPSTTAAAASSTAAPTSTTSTSATAGPCADVSVPADADAVSTASGDLDGDGATDTITVHRTDADHWRVVVELGAGGGADHTIEESSLVARALGASSISGDGAETAFVQVDAGASAAVVGLFALDGCTLRRVTVGGAPTAFPVGASVSFASGLACLPADPGLLEERSGQSADGETYQYDLRRLRLDGTELTPVDSDTGTYTRPDDNEAITGLAALDCPGVGL